MGLDVVVDSGDQIRDVGKRPSTDALVGNLAEPASPPLAFSLRAGSGNEMQGGGSGDGVSSRRIADARLLVRSIALSTIRCKSRSSGVLIVDQLQEANKLLMAMPRHAIANDGAIEHVQCSEQGFRRAIAFVVVRLPGRDSLASAARAAASAVEGLDLTFSRRRRAPGLCRADSDKVLPTTSWSFSTKHAGRG